MITSRNTLLSTSFSTFSSSNKLILVLKHVIYIPAVNQSRVSKLASNCLQFFFLHIHTIQKRTNLEKIFSISRMINSRPYSTVYNGSHTLNINNSRCNGREPQVVTVRLPPKLYWSLTCKETPFKLIPDASLSGASTASGTQPSPDRPDLESQIPISRDCRNPVNYP